MAHPDYPEHAKLAAVADQSQAIGEFLEGGGFILAEYVTFEGHDRATLVPVGRSINDILAAYFDIDLAKIEAEKRAMLASLRGES